MPTHCPLCSLRLDAAGSCEQCPEILRGEVVAIPEYRPEPGLDPRDTYYA
jgi:hypothetical protein